MPLDRLNAALGRELAELRETGTDKGAELVTVGVCRAQGTRGPRFLLAGHGDTEFLRMNSNAYLGLGLREEVIAAEEAASRKYGAGPGAVRFISGTYDVHVELERRLAAFHGRAAGMIFSSAYATVLGTLVPLITDDTVVISDALNHNCIINAMRLSRPAAKAIYAHNDIAQLEARLEQAAERHARAIVVTDGVFSMRGDFAPLDRISALVRSYEVRFEEGCVLVVDDSHGVAAYGETGRGTEEETGGRADIIVATLGKGLGVNGGYVVADGDVVAYLREKAPLYIYSNPITPAEAAAALASLAIVDSGEGQRLLAHLREMTRRFERGLVSLGYETIPGPHPVVPLMMRDTAKTAALVGWLFDHGVLATGLNYPVVPQGDQEIRFQVSADHTRADIDLALDVLGRFPGRRGA